MLTFTPSILAIHCFVIYLFRCALGQAGIFYGSIFSFSAFILFSFVELAHSVCSGKVFFLSLGRLALLGDDLDLPVTFCVDSLALLLAMLVAVLTALAMYFGVEYMARDEFAGRLLYLLNLFAASVIFLFFCYDFFLIMLSWECIGLFSLLLVNFYSAQVYVTKAAIKTFTFSRVSDAFLFAALVLSIVYFGTGDLSMIFAEAPFFAFFYIFSGNCAVHFLSFFAFCIALSAVTKCAQILGHP